mmetsp:Transcript_30368/g.49510  ORF Transcript_30368/g.49510 Transcript_30368/m.49510 type:complete len:184 (+) Transcript_30368:75-626(+)
MEPRRHWSFALYFLLLIAHAIIFGKAVNPVLRHIENTTLLHSYYQYPEMVASVVSRTITVNDTDPYTNILTKAIFSVSSGFSVGDVFFFDDTDYLSGDMDVLQGVLTIDGNTTVANFQDALQSVTYKNIVYQIKDSPNYHDKTISIQVVDDKGDYSNTLYRDVRSTTAHRVYTDGTPGEIEMT